METNKLPTARELIDSYNELPLLIDVNKQKLFIKELMIEFAKIYGKEILKQASEKAEIIFDDGECDSDKAHYIDKDSILNAYNLDEIK